MSKMLGDISNRTKVHHTRPSTGRRSSVQRKEKARCVCGHNCPTVFIRNVSMRGLAELRNHPLGFVTSNDVSVERLLFPTGAGIA